VSEPSSSITRAIDFGGANRPVDFHGKDRSRYAPVKTPTSDQHGTISYP
jgi:hypothetical protein